MEENLETDNKLSRRGAFPILAGTIFIPFFGISQAIPQQPSVEKEEYQTLLRPDGKVVKVKVSSVQKAKVLKKNMSNTTLLNWLGKKF